ncbi:MAG TPA: hypothetical protein VHX12_10430 [Acidisoma sp.]|jgi:hypothetical protein|nr:hypothetical protein [Acidisoma sp.]
MRRIALTGLVFLSGCTGFGHFVDQTHTLKSNPNAPAGDSITMQRANGQAGAVTPLEPESGQVWPTAIPQMPTLADIQKQMDLNGNGAPQLGPVPSGPGQIPNLGTLPGMQGVTPAPQAPIQPAPRLPSTSNPLPNAAPMTSLSPPPSLTMPKIGTAVPTPLGSTTITGGTANYQTLGPINGQAGAILIPNGNGTSTLVMPNGTINTVQSPH